MGEVGNKDWYRIQVNYWINPQPDWEWVHLFDDPGEFELTGMTAYVNCGYVPEPGTIVLVGLGVVALAGVMRRKMR